MHPKAFSQNSPFCSNVLITSTYLSNIQRKHNWASSSSVTGLADRFGLFKCPFADIVCEFGMKLIFQNLHRVCFAPGLPPAGDRPFITELSVSIKLSLLLWQQHYSSGLGLAKQRLASRSHLLLPIDRCSLHYQHRGYLHDTGAPRMLMMLLSATGMLVSSGRVDRGRGKEGAKARQKRGDKERQYGGTLQRVKV